MKKIISLLLAFIMCLSMCACGSEKETAVSNLETAVDTVLVEETETVVVETEPKAVTVELTIDNWQEYFEIINEPSWTKNAFDEIEYFSGVTVFLQLKEEYQNRLTSIENCAVEVQYNQSVVGCEYDIEAETFSLTDSYAISEEITTKTFNVKEYSCSIAGGGYFDSIQGYVCDGIYGSFTNCMCYPINIEITRIQGTLTLCAE